MPKTIQIRNIDDDVYAGLVRRAAEDGVTVPELLRREAIKLATRPSMAVWLERMSQRPRTEGTIADTLAALDEIRGPWPGADR